MLSVFYLYSLRLALRSCFLFPVKNGSDKYCENLQRKVDRLKTIMNVNIPIKLAANDASFWNAHGGVFLGQGGITVHPQETNVYLNSDYHDPILAHEISHIKHNDGISIVMIGLITFVTSSFLLWNIFPKVGFFELVYLVDLAALPSIALMSIRSINNERRADSEARTILTPVQKIIFSKHLESVKNWQLKELKEKGLSWTTLLWRNLSRNSEGTPFPGMFTHPSLAERIENWRR